MSTKIEVPVIRFKGYSNAWDICNLGAKLIFLKGKGLPLSSFWEGSDVPAIAYGHLYTQYDEVIHEVKLSSNSDGVVSIAGDLLFPGSSTVPFGTAQSNAIMIDGVKLGGDVIIGRQISNSVFAPFLSYQINAQKRKLFSIIVGTTITHMYGKDLAKINYSFPNFEEQVNIGNFFCRLDNLIALQNRKIIKLKNIKKAMLEKMFANSNSCVPVIRFVGFDNVWEQQKLEKIAEFSKGLGYSKNDLMDTGTPIILYGMLYTKYQTVIDKVETYTIAKTGSLYSFGGEVIIPASGETAEDIARASVVAKSGVLLGGDLNVIYPKEFIDSTFLALSISYGKQQRELSKKAQGKSVVHLRKSDLQEVELTYPEFEEQVKISNFFSNLEKLITLHQYKYEKLQNLKKAYLSKLFI